jgi:hypothetical protein
MQGINYLIKVAGYWLLGSLSDQQITSKQQLKLLSKIIEKPFNEYL